MTDWDAQADDASQLERSRPRRGDGSSNETTVSLRLPLELAERARERASQLGVSTSALIRDALSDALRTQSPSAYMDVVPMPYSTSQVLVWTFDQTWAQVRAGRRTSEADVTGLDARASA